MDVEYEALEKGIQQGASERNIEIARNALQMEIAIDDIVKLTGLTREEIENLR